MAWRPTDIGLRIQLDPDVARRQIERAIAKAKGNKAEAARAIGVDYRTFARWIKKLESLGYPLGDQKKTAA